MRQYRVRPDFWTGRHPFEETIAEAVAQLVARYGLRGKRILSLGGGRSFEERRLAECNDVTVIDIDLPNRDIEPALQSAAPGSMRYVIGDALEPWPEPF